MDGDMVELEAKEAYVWRNASSLD